MIHQRILYLSEYESSKTIMYLLLADFKNNKTFMGIGKIRSSESDLIEVAKIMKGNLSIIQIPINKKTFLSMLELNYEKDIHNKKTLEFLKKYNLEEWCL